MSKVNVSEIAVHLQLEQPFRRDEDIKEFSHKIAMEGSAQNPAMLYTALLEFLMEQDKKTEKYIEILIQRVVDELES